MIGGNGTPVKIELPMDRDWLQPRIQVNQQVIASEEIIKNLITADPEAKDHDDSI
jgi:hypothetical protein